MTSKNATSAQRSPLNRGRVSVIIAFVYTAILCLIPVEETSASTNDAVPAFVAEASISVEVYQRQDNSLPQIKRGGTVFFYYKQNGLWQIRYHRQWIETSSTALKGAAGVILDCKKIPDGVRWFTIAEQNKPNNEAMPLAFVEPNAFPPPEETELFLSWLCLCPNPELPIIDANHMWRLGRSKLINHPNNQGNYAVENLKPEDIFVSRLDITNNNGIIFKSDGKQEQLDPPFAKGFKEFTYQASEAAIFNGLSFPKKATLYKFQPRFGAKSSDDVYAAVVGRLELRRVEIWNESMETNFLTPGLIAQDRRFQSLSNGTEIGYRVVGDQWSPVTSSNLTRAAKAYGVRDSELAKFNSKSPNVFFVRLILGLLIILPLFAYTAITLSRKLKKQKTKN